MFIISVVHSALLSAASAVIIPKTLFGLFETNIRFSGVSICYNFANTIFGGFAPVISLLLIKVSGSNMAPPFYLVALSLIALFAASLFYGRKAETLLVE